MYGLKKLQISILCLIALLFSSTSIYGQEQKMDCSLCHYCENPTADNVCLRKCPRGHGNVAENGKSGPDIVILNAIEDQYEPVRFDHKTHSSMVAISGGCVRCHHYSESSTTFQPCEECHPKEIKIEDIKQPGLKGAYHRQCLGCHIEWDRDTACSICHEKKDAAHVGIKTENVEFHRRYEPVHMNDMILFKTEDDTVPFHHKRHASMYTRSCSVCHKQQACSQCHVHTSNGTAMTAAQMEIHPMGQLSEIDLHDTCFACHEDDDCEKCHGQDPDYVFTHEQTGFTLQAFHQSVQCRDCHNQEGKIQKLNRDCTACHASDWEPEDFDHKTVGVELDELHVEASCSDCHANGLGSPTSCDGCHDDNRKYDAVKGFGSTE